MQMGTWMMTAGDDWRVICACQNHRSRRITDLTGTLKRSAGALILMLPLAFGAFGLPIDSLTKGIDTLRRADVVLAGEEPELLSASAPQQLSLITPEVRESFLSSREASHRLDVEKFRESFFVAKVPYGQIIYREARKQGLAPELVAAVIDAESDFRPSLVSNRNAQGLMQIIPSTGRLMGANNLFNPTENIRAGTRYLRYLKRRFPGDSQLVLAAYNAGEGVIGRFGGIPPYPETQQYVKRVAVRTHLYEKKIDSAVASYVRFHTRSQAAE